MPPRAGWPRSARPLGGLAADRRRHRRGRRRLGRAGTDLTGVLYAGIEVGPDDAHYIGLLAAAFALGLPAFSAQYVALRGFYAFEDTRTPFLLQVVIASVNVGLALVAYEVLPLELKMIGVAVAYAVTYVVGLALTTAVLRRRTGGLDGPRVIRTYVRLLVAGVVAGGLAWTASHLVSRPMGPAAWRRWPAWRPAGWCSWWSTWAWRGPCGSRS